MAKFSIEREIVLTNEDAKKIAASKPSPLMLAILDKTKDRVETDISNNIQKHFEKYLR